MMKKRIISAVLAAMMLVSSSGVNTFASNSKATGNPTVSTEATKEQETANKDQATSGNALNKEDIENAGGVDLVPADNSEEESSQVEKEQADSEAPEKEAYKAELEAIKASEQENMPSYEDDELVTIIVETEKDSLLDAGYSVNQISANKNWGLKIHKALQASSLSSLERKLENKINDTLDILWKYNVSITGLAIRTEYSNLSKIQTMEGVKSAWVSPQFYLTDLETNTSNASTIIGADKVWNTTGYTGQGMKIAIIDTGIYLSHDSFKALDADKLTATSLTAEGVAEVYSKLNASKLYASSLGVYRTTKIPFAFNYVGGNLDVSHKASDHGSHVAGIAAANKISTTEVVGVAPDAQLVVMQVFSPDGGADFANVLAAMEDAVYLNVDVMNLSLGSTAGFTDSDEKINSICDKFSNTDIQVAIAAGNDYDSAYQNLLGANMNLASNPDTGLIGTPGSYTAPMTVASLDNTAITTFTFTVAGKKIGYTDSNSTNYTNWLNAMGYNTSYEYVWVGDGVYGGSVTDFTDASDGSGVAGKVALVQRGGGVAFTDKQKNAKDAGAVACIVYNNTAGSFGMITSDGSGNIPCISISKADGQWLIENLANGAGSLTTGNGKQETIVSDSAIMSDFSSWGVTPSLNLKPDITGVGGNINSTRDNNTYGLMSGTSMATPQIAGASAVALQYIKDKLAEGLSEEEVRNAASALMMSTADPILAPEGIEYSPRKQGAGLMNLEDLVNTKAYLTSDNQEDGRPKAELGDDPAKTGSYSFSFMVNNITNEELSYKFDSTVLTEALAQDQNGQLYMAAAPVSLEDAEVSFDYDATLIYDFNRDGVLNTPDARILLLALAGKQELSLQQDLYKDVNGDGEFTQADADLLVRYIAEYQVDRDMTAEMMLVNPKESAEVTVTINLSEEDKAYMDNFENGIYVEGFVYAYSENNDIEALSMPFMGFYGDWTDAPIYDGEEYHHWDSEGIASLYPRYIFTDSFLLGVNPYVSTPYNEAHNVVSYANGLAEIDMGLLRNAKTLEYEVKNAETGEVYWTLTDKDVSKSYYNTTYGQIIPYFIYNPQGGEKVLWDGTDADGSRLPENTKVTLTLTASVDYEGANKEQTLEFPITIDNSKPVINSDLEALKTENVDGRNILTLNLQDNQYIAAVLFVSPTGKIMNKASVDNTPGVAQDFSFDVTGFGEEFTLVVADYACNEYEVDVEVDLGDAWDETQLPLNQLDKDKLYAFESSENSAMNYGWYSANKTDLSALKQETYESAGTYYSAEYIDGYVYAQNTAGQLVVISPRNTYWKENVLSQQDKVILYDMAFDYSSDTLYAVGWDYNIGEKGASVLATVDLASGSISRKAVLIGFEGTQETMVTLGCTTEGQLYGVDITGYLYKISKAEDGKISSVALTGFARRSDYYGVNAVQSMAYDHNTNTMYWNAFSYTYDVNTNTNKKTSDIYTLDLETGATKEVGNIRNGCGVGMFIPYDSGRDILADSVLPTYVQAASYSVTLLPTQRTKLSLKWEPWNASAQPVEWQVTSEMNADGSEAESGTIVSVDQRGRVTALKPGTASVMAKTTVYPEWNNGEAYAAEAYFTVKVLNSTDELYGFMLVDINDQTKNQNTWITFRDVAPESYNVLTASEGESFTYYSGAYYDHNIYAVSLENEGRFLYKIPVVKGENDTYAQIGEKEKIAPIIDTNITDMTFDYTTGRMYAIDNRQTSLYISIIDLETGAVDPVGELSHVMVGLAGDEKGTLYAVDWEGVLYTIDGETGVETEVYNTGVAAGGTIQSMAYDYNSGNLYWAQCTGAGTSSFYLLNKQEDEWGWTSWQTVKLGDIGGKKGAEVAGLFTIPQNEPEAAYIPVEGVTIDQSDFSIIKGASFRLTATTTPKRPTVQTKTWTSDKPEVIEVDGLGNIKALSAGTATITVKAEGKKGDGPFTASITITVYESSGNLKAFINQDYANGYWCWWGEIPDYAPSQYKATESATSAFNLMAGDYFDGNIYAYDFKLGFYEINAETHSYTKLGQLSESGSSFSVLDMTYDYALQKMLALAGTSNGTSIYTVDMTNGAMTELCSTSEIVYGLAYGNDSVYTLKNDGTLCTINTETGSLSEVLSTGASVDSYFGADYKYYGTTLAYDHNTNRLYMAAATSWSAGSMYMIMPEANVCLDLGPIGKGGVAVSAMYIEPKEGSVTMPTEALGLKLNRSSARISLEDTLQLEAAFLPSTTANKSITWTSDNTAVATVKDGLITPVAYGTATITAEAQGGIKASCVVTVVNKEETAGNTAYGFSQELGGLVTFNPELPQTTKELVKAMSSIEKVRAAAYGEGILYYLESTGGYYPRLYKMDLTTYESTVIGFVQVDVSSVGENMDMTYDPFSGALLVTSGSYIYVFDPATGEKLKSVYVEGYTPYSIAGYNSYIYLVMNDGMGSNNLYVTDFDKILASGYSLSMMNGDMSLVGALTPAIAANESCRMAFDMNNNKLYLTADGSLHSININDGTTQLLDASEALVGFDFKSPEGWKPVISVTGVELNKTETKVKVGMTVQLKATVLPVKDKVNKNVTFTSDNEKVATVDDSGAVKAVAPGTANIKVTTEDGGFTAACQVTVVEAGNEKWVYGYSADEKAFVRLDINMPEVAGEVLLPYDLGLDSYGNEVYPTGAAYLNGYVYFIQRNTATNIWSLYRWNIKDNSIEEWVKDLQNQYGSSVSLAYDLAVAGGKLYMTTPSGLFVFDLESKTTSLVDENYVSYVIATLAEDKIFGQDSRGREIIYSYDGSQWTSTRSDYSQSTGVSIDDSALSAGLTFEGDVYVSNGDQLYRINVGEYSSVSLGTLGAGRMTCLFTITE